MEFREVLSRRRMVRHYRPEPVDERVVAWLLETARRAPSAGFSQGLYFIVVTDADTRKSLATIAGEPAHVDAGFDPWMSSAPVHIAVCTRAEDYRERYREPDKLGPGGGEVSWPVPYWWVDAGAGLMLLLLAAVDEGLAAGFFGTHRLDGLSELLGVPDDVAVLGVVTIGHPAPDRRSSSLSRGWKPLGSVVHAGRWGVAYEPPA